MIIKPPFKTSLLEFYKPTVTGRIYRPSSFVVIPDSAFGVIEAPAIGKIDINEVAFQALKIRIEGNHLVADIDILNTPQGNLLRQLMRTTEYVFRTITLCNLSPHTNEVTNGHLEGTFATTKTNGA